MAVRDKDHPDSL